MGPSISRFTTHDSSLKTHEDTGVAPGTRGRDDRPTDGPALRQDFGVFVVSSVSVTAEGAVSPWVLYERDENPRDDDRGYVLTVVPTQKPRRMQITAHPGPGHICASVRPQPDSERRVRVNEQSLVTSHQSLIVYIL